MGTASQMSTSQADLVESQPEKTISEALSQLPDLQRSLLQLISIIYSPVAATPLASCAHRIGINDPANNDSFTMHSLRPVLVDLIHAGWLEGSQGRYFIPSTYTPAVGSSSQNNLREKNVSR